MVGFLGKLFGSSDTASKVVDGAIKGMDALVFTDEEKSQANDKMRDWFLRYLEASQPQNVSRRLIACVVAGVWAFLIILCAVLGCFEATLRAAEFVFGLLKEVVLQPFNIILGFYFVTQLVSRAKK